eukprot:Trichotokara_eunicae@DN3434_c0_g1_i1.p1
MLERCRRQKCVEPLRFFREVDALVKSHFETMSDDKSVSTSEVLHKMLVIACSNNVELDPAFVTGVLATGIVEGIVQTLMPKMKGMDIVRKYVQSQTFPKNK